MFNENTIIINLNTHTHINGIQHTEKIRILKAFSTNEDNFKRPTSHFLLKIQDLQGTEDLDTNGDQERKKDRSILYT